jgi:FkbM family methyltransferase
MCSGPSDVLVEIETIFGKILAFKNDFITNQIAKFGAHTRPELAFLLSIVRPGDFIFDLGAHIGTFAVPLAAKTGSLGKMLAVEGKTETFEVLRKNITNARLASGISLLNALIAHPERRYRSYTPQANTGGTYFLPDDTAGVGIEVVTIDQLCHRYFEPRIVKIDIEGGELSALAGSNLFDKTRPIFFVEINGQSLQMQGSSVGAMNDLFRGNGYRMFRNIGNRNAAHDNFIATELPEIPTGLNNLDVLAIHQTDPRLELILAAIEDG